MTGIGKIGDNSNVGAYIQGLSLGRFIPEPKNNIGMFGKALNTLGSVARTVMGTKGVSVEPEYADLLNKQIEVQQQMMVVSMQSNIEKSKHETQMAAVRNMRVG